MIILIFLAIIVSPNDDLLMGVVRQDTAYDFCMCNPPFFKDKEDKRGSIGASLGHRPVPMTRNTGNESETITEGGEVEFVKRIISDSFRLKTKVRSDEYIYNEMIEKLNDLLLFISKMVQHNAWEEIKSQTVKIITGQTQCNLFLWSTILLYHPFMHIGTCSHDRVLSR